MNHRINAMLMATILIISAFVATNNMFAAEDGLGTNYIKNIKASQDAVIEGGDLTIGKGDVAKEGTIILHDADAGDAYTTTLKGYTNLAGNIVFMMPATTGTNAQALATDGSGNLFWQDPAAAAASLALDNLASVAINTSLLPGVDDSIDLGDGTHEFKDLYIDGTANIDSLVADTADINAGNIDNTAIGAATRSTALFTTLGADGNVTLGDAAGDTITLNGVVASDIIPNADNTRDLGSAANSFNDLFIDGIATIATGVVAIADINGGNIDATAIGVTTPAAATTTVFTATGLLSANGNVVLGDADSDTVTITADVASSIIPDADGTRNLGAVGSEFGDLYITGTANIDALVADTADINAGSIDGTAIGANSRSSALFTTLGADGNITLGDAGADTLTVNATPTFTTAIAMSTNKITGLASPTANLDAANKGYVDNAINGLAWKDAVEYASTNALTLASDFENGDAIDGADTLTTGDRVLIKNQAVATQNGIYIVNASGAPTRADDMSTNTQVSAAAVFVKKGILNGDTGWVCTSEPTGAIGSFNITFAQFSTAGGYTAGDGLDLTGVDFSVDSTVVRTTGDQTINGIKTLGSFAVTPSAAPTTDYQVSNKKYVDDAITTANAATKALDNLASVAINTSLLPGVDDSIDLGDGTHEFKDLYIDGTANIDALVADTADINGGTIDATAIGVTTPAAATTTVFTATGLLSANGNVVLGDAAADTITLTGVVASDIIPNADNTIDLGSVAASYADAFIDGTATIATVDINAGNIDNTAIGAATRSTALFTTLDANGNVIIGSDGTDTVTINADLASDIIPDADNTRDLGSAAASFNDLFIDGIATIATGVVAIADINGGNIDATAIGVTTPAAATTTVFTATGLLSANGNVVLGDADSDTVTITADVASSIIPDADGTRNLGAVGSEFGDLYITGTANIDALVADTADINAGSIDGTAIGANSRSSALFTTLGADGNITLGDAGADTLTVNATPTFTTAIAMSTNKITGLASPTANLDAANKGYVDNAINGLAWKDAVEYASTNNKALATGFENGDTVDGAGTLATGDRILIKAQTDASENGIYIVNATGAPTRADDMSTNTQVSAAAVFVKKGTLNGDTGWVCTSEPSGAIGAFDIDFAQFSSAGGYTAGDGLDLTGVAFSVDNTVVRTTGDQTINGIKTLGSFAVTPSAAPTTDYQVSNKKYVDDRIPAVAATRALDNLASVAINTALLPGVDDSIDLGDGTHEFKDLYIDGTANIDALVADTADINGGTIDATAIGVTTPAAATTTVFTATGLLSANGNVVLGDAAGDTITLTGVVASDIIPNADNTLDLGSVAASYADAFIDGTATIATVDINAGNIDNTAIGAATRSTALFTTLGANGDTTLGDADTDAVTFNASATLKAKTIFTPNAVTYDIVAANGIPNTELVRSYLKVQGSGGSIDISADPQISTTGAAAGQILILHCTSGNTVKLDDGNGLALAGGASFTMNTGDLMQFIFDGTTWREMYRMDKTL